MDRGIRKPHTEKPKNDPLPIQKYWERDQKKKECLKKGLLCTVFKI
jgi:hypothetical protein